MTERYRNSFAEVNLSALAYNYRALEKLLPKGGFMAPMVKADAYGHGDVQVARVCQELGARYLGVVLIEEAVKLRKAGLAANILVFAPFDSYGAEAIVRYQLTPVLTDWEQIERLKIATHDEAAYPVHLKIQTGMGRLGFAVDEVPVLTVELAKQNYIRVQGVCTHFAMADDFKNPNGITQRQIRNFQKALEILKPLEPFEKHFLNSAALLSGLTPSYEGARPGIALYGCLPTLPVPPPVQLRPVLSLKSSVGHVQKIKKGESVSYSATWKATRDSVLAVIPLGYADGWPRALSNKAEALIRGRRVKQVGIVCMDYHMLDITDVPGVETGDEVVLIGQQKNEVITSSDVALLAGSISYEILTGIQARVPRIYVH